MYATLSLYAAIPYQRSRNIMNVYPMRRPSPRNLGTQLLTHRINTITSTSPSKTKTTTNRKQCQNYRTMSLVIYISKVMLKVIHNYLNSVYRRGDAGRVTSEQAFFPAMHQQKFL